MIDMIEFQKWILELANGRESIPNHEFFFRTEREHKDWWRPNVSSLLRYCSQNGIIRMGPSMEIIPMNISEDAKRQFNDEHRKSFKTRDDDAYLHQKELGGWFK